VQLCVWFVVLLELVALAAGQYFYLTFHGGHKKHDINNVYRFNIADGSSIDVFQDDSSLDELRGLYIRKDGSLLLSNANKDNSKILSYGSCTTGGHRTLQSVFTSYDPYANPGLEHPYGIAVSPSGDVYVSNQDTDSVTRYYGGGANMGKPMKLPPALSGGDYDPGTFAEFYGGNGVRDILFDKNGMLYVASKDSGGVVVYNSSGYTTHNISIDGPVGLAYDSVRNILYIGSEDLQEVRAWSITAHTFLPMIFSGYSLSHPAGVAVDSIAQILYVVDQEADSVLAFSTQTGDFLRTVVSYLDDSPECIILSSC